MKSAGSSYREWSRRFFGLALVVIAVASGPLIYCLMWGEAAASGEATMGYCLESHPAQFPVTLFIAGFVLLLGGMILRIQGDQEDEKEERKRRKVDRAAERMAGRMSVTTPTLRARSGRGEAGEVPDEIELDEELDLGLDTDDEDDDEEYDEDPNSVMAFLQEQQEFEERGDSERRRREQAVQEGKYYVPPGLEGAPVLYLETNVEPAAVVDGSRRIDNPNLPHDDLKEVLEHASRIVIKESTPVVVRVKPGIYQGAVEIPDRVTVINHRMPTAATVDQRLAWLREQDDVDHPDRVTFLAPSDSDFGVRMAPGQKQGLFGCYVVGRQGVEQTGLQAKHNAALAVVHCAFESFSDSGSVVVDCGEDLPGRRVQFVGCLWRSNSSRTTGGGLRIENSVVSVEASIFDSNRAPSGGGIAALRTEKPLTVVRSFLHRNRALTDKSPTDIETMPLKKWQKSEGVGGAIMVRDGLARVVDSILEGNDAAVGGGAIAAVAGRVVVKSSGEGRGVCKGNRADAGGGIIAVGWFEAPAMIRAMGAELRQNLAKSVGGAVAGVGNAVLRFENAKIETNRADGKQRGLGGGLVAWRGAGVQLIDGEVFANEAGDGGGGVAIINGSLKITGHCTIRNNRADGTIGGSGVLVVTAADRDLAGVIGQKGFTLPFKLKIEEARIRSNIGGGPGGGLRAGNLVDGTTFPLAIKIARPQWINLNEADVERRLAQNVWIEWAEELKVNDDTRSQVKLALK